MEAFLENNLFWLTFFGVAGYLVYSVFTKKGRGHMFFGGEILKTFDFGITKKINHGFKTKIRVHVIKPTKRPNDKDIGIELTQSSMFSWRMTPITLTSSEASELSSLIEKSLSEKRYNN